MAKDNAQVIASLKKLLSSSYLLYTKTHNFHWNVTGPMFTTLHNLFEQQYTEYAAAVDEIAERIRALGDFAPGSFTEFKKFSVIDEDTERRSATEMIQILVADSEAVDAAARELVEAAEAGQAQQLAESLADTVERETRA